MLSASANYLSSQPYNDGDNAKFVLSLSNHLQTSVPLWKQSLAARSRDYSINTANLDKSTSPRWVFRGVHIIMTFLLSPIRDPALAATFLRARIESCGGFITQHLLWTLQLLDLVAFEEHVSWNNVKHYCSRRNTIKLFKRFMGDFTPSPSLDITSFGSVPSETPHAFINPLRQGAVRVTDDLAGRFMVETFHSYLSFLLPFSDLEFAVSVDGTTFKHTFSAAELTDLRSWLCFCSNCCMHEKLWVDFFAEL